MPLVEDTVQVPLVGVQQKADELGRQPGVLNRAINARFRKHGDGGVRIDKRLGYQYVDPSNTVARFDTDAILTNVSTYESELVVFTYDYVAALGDRNAALRGEDSLIYRGPCNRGTCRISFDTPSRLSGET